MLISHPRGWVGRKSHIFACVSNLHFDTLAIASGQDCKYAVQSWEDRCTILIVLGQKTNIHGENVIGKSNRLAPSNGARPIQAVVLDRDAYDACGIEPVRAGAAQRAVG